MTLRDRGLVLLLGVLLIVIAIGLTILVIAR